MQSKTEGRAEKKKKKKQQVSDLMVVIVRDQSVDLDHT